MLTFATYFDSGFLVRGVTCLGSLLAHSSQPVALFVLALDEACAAALPQALAPLPPGSRLSVVTMAEFEARHPELVAVRPSRSRIEYYFTLTPLLCADALAATAPGALMVYLDADMFCFADPLPALAEVGAADVFVTEHRFAPRHAALAALYGRFNVGFLGFRNTEAGRACVDRWAGKCLEWCRIEPEDGRFGDQKYLDAWPREVGRLAVLDHAGINAGPWNVARHRYAESPSGVTLDGMPLVLFHFHRLRALGRRRYETDYHDYGRLPRVLRERIYLPYLAALEATAARLGSAGLLPVPGGDARAAHAQHRSSARALAGRLARTARLFARRRVVFVDGKVLSPIQALLGHG